jgi:hypothetical protein
MRETSNVKRDPLIRYSPFADLFDLLTSDAF